MTSGTIALWMYLNDDGNEIQVALKSRLEAKGHKVINDFDMRECYLFDGNVFTKCGQNLSQADLLYHMNADEQTAHQHDILHALDQSSVIVINKWDAFSRAKDKFITNLLLQKNEILVPPSALIPPTIASSVIERLFKEWGQVLFKPRFGYGGRGIMKFQDTSSFIDFMQVIKPYIHNYYLEKYIDFSKHDYRVEILNGQVIGSYCRRKTHNFKTNVFCGGSIMVKDFSFEYQSIALKAANIIGVNTTIVDMVKSKQDGKIYVLEVNEIMGAFIEAYLQSKGKDVIKEIKPIFDKPKLDALTDYLDTVIQKKYSKK